MKNINNSTKFDTHSLVKEFLGVNFSEKQAELITKIIANNNAKTDTKIFDIKEEQIKLKIEQIKTDNTAQDFKEKLGDVATKEFVRGEIQKVRTEIVSSANKTLIVLFGIILTVSTLQLGALVFIVN